MSLLVSVALVVFGIAILGFGADVLVRGAAAIADGSTPRLRMARSQRSPAGVVKTMSRSSGALSHDEVASSPSS